MLFSHYVTHHAAALYPEPEVFRPDRWLTIDPSPYEYLPFSAGPRICVGAAFATMAIKIVLAMILARYRVQSYRGRGSTVPFTSRSPPSRTADDDRGAGSGFRSGSP